VRHERAQGPLGDPEVQGRLKELGVKVDSQQAADFDAVMRTPQGRRFFYVLVFLLGHLESPSYDNSGQSMAFREGRRSVAIELRDWALAVCPDLWLEMISEQISAAQQKAEERRNAARKEEQST
jgi:hypothetical protein